jgi:hypothetical protein
MIFGAVEVQSEGLDAAAGLRRACSGKEALRSVHNLVGFSCFVDLGKFFFTLYQAALSTPKLPF